MDKQLIYEEHQLTIVVVAVIILLQIWYFIKAWRKRVLLKKIFPTNIGEEIGTYESDGVTLIGFFDLDKIRVHTGIVETINSYLTENKGLSIDYHLIKDIVDRNCDIVEDEISTITPVPIYFGLIGTMVGILLGVGFFVFYGGLESMLGGVDSDMGGGIIELLGGVAVAMISSISGLLMTVYSSSKATSARSILNENKNSFLSWIQCNLLPTMSDSATSAIQALQSNLSTFNEAFAGNIVEMKESFSQMSVSSKDQLEVVQAIERMNMTQMAKANIAVLTELQKSTKEFERFNSYMHKVNDYLTKVTQLNDSVNEHLNRTKAIEDMGQFFQKEITQIELRKGVINESAGKIDFMLSKAMNQLHDSTKEQIGNMIEFSTTQNVRFTTVIEAQLDQMKEFSKSQNEKIVGVIEEQRTAFSTKVEETSKIVDELKNLSEVKASMLNLEKATIEQNNKIDSLTNSILQLANVKVEGAHQPKVELMPSWMKYVVVSSLSIIGVGGLFYISQKLVEYTKILIE